MAMGVPLGLAIAMSARTAAARSAALAAVPVIVLTGFFTISRGGILALRRRAARRARDHARPRPLARQAGAGRGGRGDPRQGRPAARRAARRRAHARSPHRQGDELLVIVLVVVAGIVLVTSERASPAPGASPPRCRRCAPRSAAWPGAAVARRRCPGAADVRRLRRAGRPLAGVQEPAARDRQRRPPPRHLQRRGPLQVLGQRAARVRERPCRRHRRGQLRNWWEAPRHAVANPSATPTRCTRRRSASSGSSASRCSSASSLWSSPRACAASAARTGPPPALLAGATAACAAFAVAAGVDWLWQVTVLPVCFLLLAAAVLAPARAGRERPAAPPGARRARRHRRRRARRARRPARRRDAAALQPAGRGGQPARPRPAPGQHLAPRPALRLLAAAAARAGPGAARRPPGAVSAAQGGAAQGAHQLAPALRTRQNPGRDAAT